MKKRNLFLMMALYAMTAMALVSCGKDYKIQLSSQNLWFGLGAETQTIKITSNCKWTITRNDNADWYTINMMSGEKDAILSIEVEDFEGDYRGSSFVIVSPGGHVRRTVFVSQKKLDFDGMVNKIFGVMSVEHWNTDYYGQIIEDSYKHYEFNPYDTTTGYLMYFLENGQGVQRDHDNDTAVYYAFTYEYNPIDQILHIEFETTGDEPESYDPQVLTASDSLYRFIHEYKPDFWERADMRKVGVYNPEGKANLRQKAIKRRDGEGIFGF
jgi:hypothetical protein